jgi:prefoldin subunit 5
MASLADLRAEVAQLSAKIAKLEEALGDAVDKIGEEFGEVREELEERYQERAFERLDARDGEQKLERRLGLLEESLQSVHEALRTLKHHGDAGGRPKRKHGPVEVSRNGRKKQRKE